MIDKSYQKLPACRSAMRLTHAVYVLTQHFPDDEKSGLTATLKRAAASIPTQLAESHCQSDTAACARELTEAQTTLRKCAAYLDVAWQLRMTARWRFHTPRRWALKVSRNLDKMLKNIYQE